MNAKFIFKGKEILSVEKDIDDLPKKNSYITIEDKDYLVFSFDIFDTSVFYVLK